MSAGNLAFFKAKLSEEQKRDEKEDEDQDEKEEGGGVVSVLAPWVKRLPPDMRLSLEGWAVNKVSDMRACYVAFFLGSGCINDRLVKMRRLVIGRVFWSCRSRLLAYLVPRAPARQRIRVLALSAVPVSSSTAAESPGDLI